MKYCHFQPTEFPRRYRCAFCGHLTPETSHPPERVYRYCGVHFFQRVQPRSRGLGDTLAWLIKLLTFGWVAPCAACNSRRAWLNRKFPYRL